MSPVKLLLKILGFVAVFGVIALIFARIFMQGFWPSTAKNFKMTEAVYQKHSTNVDNLSVYTQSLRIPYDDSKKGIFFADHLYCIPDDGHVQISIRKNRSSDTTLDSYYGGLPEGDILSQYDFVLCAAYETLDKKGDFRYYPATVSEFEKDSFLMYDYAKLAFDNVSFDSIIYIRLEIYKKGAFKPDASEEEKKDIPCRMIPIYEHHVIYTNGNKVEYELHPYKLSKGEKSRA